VTVRPEHEATATVSSGSARAGGEAAIDSAPIAAAADSSQHPARRSLVRDPAFAALFDSFSWQSEGMAFPQWNDVPTGGT
jgi:hypothetical protein